jgi:molybdopterin-containing oxidoreductase family iron-sulfur binding subunit
MSRYAMVIDLDKCVACQGCSVACRFENNTPAMKPDEAIQGRSIRWNDVFPTVINPIEETGEYPYVNTRYMTRPCMHCENPPCIKVCPVQATYQDDDGLVRQNYDRCIGCRFCTVACPYGVRYFNWQTPYWEEEFKQHISPDRVEGNGVSEGPVPRQAGVVEKCTFCVHRLSRAREEAEAEGREMRSDEYIPACVQTCVARARFFGDLDDPESTVSKLTATTRSFRLLEDVGTHPKVIYLREG